MYAPFEATFSVRFRGVLQSDSSIEIVHPSGFDIEVKSTAASTYEIACTANIGAEVYRPSCAFTPKARLIVFKYITAINQDFTSKQNGEMIVLKVTNVFLNPKSEEPVPVDLSLKFKDGLENVISYYDSQTADRKISYVPQAIEVRRFSVLSLN